MSNELVAKEPNLNIFKIESELAELMEYRDTEDLTPEERQAVDNQIAEYVSRELTKVDNLRAYMRHCEVKAAQARAAADIAKEEFSQQMKRAGSWETRLDYLKGCCLAAMGILKKKRLEGRSGYLLCKGNGGPQMLTVYDVQLLPSSCKTLSLRVSLAEWERFATECNQMAQSMQVALSRLMTSQGFESLIEANQKAIRRALDIPCPDCVGGTIEDVEGVRTPCPGCSGTGKQGLPGARLEPRGSHIEVQ